MDAKTPAADDKGTLDVPRTYSRKFSFSEDHNETKLSVITDSGEQEDVSAISLPPTATPDPHSIITATENDANAPEHTKPEASVMFADISIKIPPPAKPSSENSNPSNNPFATPTSASHPPPNPFDASPISPTPVTPLPTPHKTDTPSKPESHTIDVPAGPIDLHTLGLPRHSALRKSVTMLNPTTTTKQDTDNKPKTGAADLSPPSIGMLARSHTTAVRRSITKEVTQPMHGSDGFISAENAPKPLPAISKVQLNQADNPLFSQQNLKSNPALARKKSKPNIRRMSLGAALCIPPPPRIDNNMNFKKFIKLSMGAIGIVYGDIAVSPIFVLRSMFAESVSISASGELLVNLDEVNETTIFAVLSFLVWVITFVCCLKYIIFVLRADKNGEGGTWALVSLLPTENEDAALWDYKKYIFALGCFGASFLLADGFIAPAICVLSAFEGVKDYSNGGLSTGGVVALSCAVLFLLMMSQRFGTSKALKFYGPVMFLWFLTILLVGLYNIITYHPRIFWAISPHHWFMYIIHEPQEAYSVLSQIVLAVSGVEALYADLGHFKTVPIRSTFLALVYPALILNYFGQGAFMIVNPNAAVHPFFHSVPPSLKWPVLVLATLAAIIASQATISGCFTLIDQGISLKVFPNIKTVHTSAESAGAVYIPTFNYMLMVGSIALIAIFQDSDKLANIFGIGVTGTMICTTCFYILAMKYKFNDPKWQIILFSIVFLSLDVILVISSLRKVISYGWVTILLGLSFFFLMHTWYTTSNQINDVMSTNFMEISELRQHVKSIHRTQGTVVYVSNQDEDVPNVLRICAEQLRSLPENIVCMSAISSSAPFVAEDERYVFRTVDAVAGIYRLVISYGYAERTINTVTAVERARKRGLRVKADERVTFVVGNELVACTPETKSFLTKLRVKAFGAIAANTEGLVDYYNLPPQDTLEIGRQLLI